MTDDAKRQRELLLIEILRAALDLRNKAAAAQAPMLAYLADLLVKRTGEELEALGVPLGPTDGFHED